MVVTSFSDFMANLFGARFTFAYLWELITGLYNLVIADANVLEIWNVLKDFAASFWGAIPYIIMSVGLIVLLFGKKISGILKFLGFFVIGFFLGVYFLVPVIPPEVPIPGWVIGLVVGIIAAVLSKFVFVASYSVLFLYSVYRFCYHGFFLDFQEEFSTGKALTALAVATVLLIVTLVFFRFVEMLLFSSFGAWLMSAGFGMAFIDLAAIPKLGDKSWILEVSIIGVLTLLGFIFQFKTRRRY